MARVLATVSGVAIKPGVSLNRRWYRPEMLAAAVGRAQGRIAAGEALNLTERNGEAPAGNALTQLTHHAAEDDSTRIVGRITSLTLGKGGEVCYEAALAPTPAGKTIAALLDTSDGQPPYLRGVSIRGAWLGKIREVTGPDGQPATTADGLELDGLDYTASPGVPGAQVTSFAWADGKPEESGGRVLITESVQEARVTISEETTAPEAAIEAAAPPEGVREALRALLGEPEPVAEADTPAVSKRGSGLSGTGRVWADPGYQADKKQRYDLSTKAKAKAAWSFINQADNAKAYTAAQLKRVKGRIIKALKSFGVTVAAEGWTIGPAFQVTEAVTEWMGDDPSRAGSWCITASNGPVSLNMSSYCMDPADLDVILRAAADAACTALKALDPDMDGDIDLPGAPASDTDHDRAGESAPPAVTTETAPAPAPAGDAGGTGPAQAGHREEEEEPAMADTTEKAAGTQPAGNELSPEMLKAIGEAAAGAAAAALEARETAAKAEAKAARKAAKKAAREAAKGGQGTTETTPAAAAPAVTEKSVDDLVTERLQEMVASGAINVGRAGLAGLNEHRVPGKEGGPDALDPEALRKLDSDSLADYAGAALDQHVYGRRGLAVHS